MSQMKKLSIIANHGVVPTVFQSGVVPKLISLDRRPSYLVDHFEDESMVQWLSRVSERIDFDTTRFNEIVWADRLKHGLRSSCFTHRTSDNFIADREALRREFLDRWPTGYDTNNTIRIFLSDAELRDGGYEHVVGAYIVIGFSSTGAPSFMFSGDPELVAALHEEFSLRFSMPDSVLFTKLTGFSADGSAQVTSKEVVYDKSVKAGYDEFYPFIQIRTNDGVSHPFNFELFTKEYFASSENGLILYGLPGLGKSAFIRRLANEAKTDKVYVVSGSDTVMHPSFIPWLNSLQEGSLLIIEEAQHILGDREKTGNTQLGNILEYLDGIVQNNTKIVFSTNQTSLSKMDAALGRIGRCYDQILFKKLVGEQINIARAAIGRDPLEITESLEMTLSEALNYRGAGTHKSGSIGFVGSV